MKYLFTLLLFGLVACDKDDAPDTQNIALPTVTNIATTSEVINGVARPKFTITVDVPDASVVSQLEVYKNAEFPRLRTGRVTSPTSTQYIIIDSSAIFQPSTPIKYFAFFTLKNYNYVSYYPFELK